MRDRFVYKRISPLYSKFIKRYSSDVLYFGLICVIYLPALFIELQLRLLVGPTLSLTCFVIFCFVSAFFFNISRIRSAVLVKPGYYAVVSKKDGSHLIQHIREEALYSPITRFAQIFNLGGPNKSYTIELEYRSDVLDGGEIDYYDGSVQPILNYEVRVENLTNGQEERLKAIIAYNLSAGERGKVKIRDYGSLLAGKLSIIIREAAIEFDDCSLWWPYVCAEFSKLDIGSEVVLLHVVEVSRKTVLLES